MKLDHVQDSALRDWIVSYTQSKLAERKANKSGSADLTDAWKTYSEGDWCALRELLELRPRAHARFERADIEWAIQRKVAEQPPRLINGTNYCSPYTMGLEVAALRELLHQGQELIGTQVELIA